MLELIAPFVSKTFGVDGLSQVNLLNQFTRLFAAGVWIPRWAPEGYSGFGVASFYFYPPLSLYIGSIIRVVTGIVDPKVLFHLTGLVGTIASLFTAAYAFRSFAATKYQQWLAAALYAFAPMRVAELYSRSSLSTHVAYVFLPLVWVGVVEVVRHKDRVDLRSVILLGVSSALLALTSIPFAMVTAVCMVIGAIIYRKDITKSVLWQAVLAAGVSIVLYASQLTAVLSAQHFVRLEDLIVIDPEYILTNLLHGAGFPAAYHVGLLYLCVAIAVFTSRSQNITADHWRFVRFGMWTALIIAFLEIPVITKWIWSTIPPFPIIQGVWRFYAELVLFATVFVAIASATKERRVASWIVGIFAGFALIPISLVVFHVHMFAHSEPFYGDPSEYRPLYSVRRDDAWWTMKRHTSDPEAQSTLAPTEVIQNVRDMQTDVAQTFNVSLQSPHDVTFHRFQWPYWYLYVQGREIVTRPDSIGRATAILPQGQYRAEWKLEPPLLERAGRWVSGIAWAVLLFFTLPMLFLRRPKRKYSPEIA